MGQAKLFVVENIDEATDLFINTLRARFSASGFVVKEILTAPMNFHRHKMVSVAVAGKGFKRFKFYVVFQRRWFESFSKYFKVASEAVTINLAILVKLCKHGYDRIVWVSSDGSMFWIDPRRMLRLVKERGWIRETQKTGEVVAHVPLEFLTKIR
ncbi:MAG: hypothetical protein ACTSXC_07330 [Candidatus Freyarchaeota archaeon]